MVLEPAESASLGNGPEMQVPRPTPRLPNQNLRAMPSTLGFGSPEEISMLILENHHLRKDGSGSQLPGEVPCLP